MLYSLLDNVDSDLRCPPSFLPPPYFPWLLLLTVLCVINSESSPLPSPSIRTLSSKSAQTSCGVSQQSRTFSLSFFISAFCCARTSLSREALHWCVHLCKCVWGDILWRRNDCGQLWAWRSRATLSLRCPSMTETHLQESSSNRGCVRVCVCMHVCETLQT